MYYTLPCAYTYTYILGGRARICHEASMKFWYAAQVIQFLHISTDIWTGFHTILSLYCMFINFPFWPEMAKMMILSDCYQVNLMIDHRPAQLKIGFINFTAISEFYLLFLGHFFLPPLSSSDWIIMYCMENWRLWIIYQLSVICDESKLLSASSSLLSIISHVGTSLHLHTMRTSY